MFLHLIEVYYVFYRFPFGVINDDDNGKQLRVPGAMVLEISFIIIQYLLIRRSLIRSSVINFSRSHILPHMGIAQF